MVQREYKSKSIATSVEKQSTSEIVILQDVNEIRMCLKICGMDVVSPLCHMKYLNKKVQVALRYVPSLIKDWHVICTNLLSLHLQVHRVKYA